MGRARWSPTAEGDSTSGRLDAGQPVEELSHADPSATSCAIADEPDDDGLRLIFADWLADHGKPRWAALLRRQVGDCPADPDGLHEDWCLGRGDRADVHLRGTGSDRSGDGLSRPAGWGGLPPRSGRSAHPAGPDVPRSWRGARRVGPGPDGSPDRRAGPSRPDCRGGCAGRVESARPGRGRPRRRRPAAPRPVPPVRRPARAEPR